MYSHIHGIYDSPPVSTGVTMSRGIATRRRMKVTVCRRQRQLKPARALDYCFLCRVHHSPVYHGARQRHDIVVSYPYFTAGLEPLARGCLYPTDDNTYYTIYSLL